LERNAEARNRPSHEGLLGIFGQHILGLLVVAPGEPPNVPQCGLYTGMLLEYKGITVWLTAGHVIRHLRDVRSRFSPSCVRASWYTDHEQPSASRIPIAFDQLFLFELDSRGVDIGFASIDHYSRGVIGANPKCRALTSVAWAARAVPKQDTHFLVGYAKEHTSVDSLPLCGREVQVGVRFALTCLGVREIQPRATEPQEFWHHEEAFYGELVALKREQEQIHSIEGMSGGPIFLAYDERGGVRYHLVAVQSAWLPSEAVLRAARIENVETMMEGVCRAIDRDLPQAEQAV
jgi:hypothetical protein